jgi:hypothetical protein
LRKGAKPVPIPRAGMERVRLREVVESPDQYASYKDPGRWKVWFKEEQTTKF